MPGTLPATSSAIFVMPSPGWKVTVADVLSSSGAWPDCASSCESAIERQVACAAAISSSGLVIPPGSSERAGQLTSKPPTAPLVTVSMRPVPLIRSPCHVTSALRSVAIRFSLQGRLHRHLPARLDQLRKGAALARAPRHPVERPLVHFFYTRAREKLGGDDPVRAVLDLVERHRRADDEGLRLGAGA